MAHTSCPPHRRRWLFSCFKSTGLDVIISDLGLPDVDGWALLRAVRGLSLERAKRIPAIALTADDRPATRAGSLSAGYALHLTKPVSPDDLAHRVALLVKRSMSDSIHSSIDLCVHSICGGRVVASGGCSRVHAEGTPSMPTRAGVGYGFLLSNHVLRTV